MRTIPDYPKPGIMFRDITTLLGHANGFRACVEQLARRSPIAGSSRWRASRRAASSWAAPSPTACAAASCRSARRASCRRKAIGQEYELEYGIDVIEIHEDAISAGEPVLLVDDLIATGGTARPRSSCCASSKADVVGAAFVIDLPDLGGCSAARQARRRCHTLMSFEGD